MKPKLVVAISALAIPALAHAQQSGPPNVPKPTKADAQNVVQIITNDKAKAQAYCDLSKLSDQVEAAGQKNDTKKVETLAKQVDALVAKVGPEYSKLMDGLPRRTRACALFNITALIRDPHCIRAAGAYAN